ncbi:DUF308 domain-containing protein [Kineococcus sp. R86509]|uniref:DUF308 domain-containing protein n=1 Tax=Kineococcus sp. R86509 TaxID=3093851 RepID=UPI0036D31646
MTQQTTSPSQNPTTVTVTPDGLRTLHLVRAVVSAVWVVLVLTTSASLVATDVPTAVAGVLLVVYPVWDAVATLLERRVAGTDATGGVRTLNVVLGLAAAVAMVVAVRDSVGSALLVFGVWALVSGAVQLAVALRRRRTVGAQWPMVASGGLSVVAGAFTALSSTSASSGLSSLAGYSAVGALWFLVSVVALSVRVRRTAR